MTIPGLTLSVMEVLYGVGFDVRSGRLSVSPVSSSQMNLILEWGGVSLI